MGCFYSKEFSINSSTDVENQFICQFLTIASGDAVKVYLYGLFLCKNSQYGHTLKDIANAVDLTEEQVIKAFKFWEEFGVVSIISFDPLSIQFLPTASASISKPKKFKTEKYFDFTKHIQAIIEGRMISTNEYTEYFNIMETYNVKPEAMIMIVRYCVDIKGKDIGYKYITKVAKDFANRGLVTTEKIEQELAFYLSRTVELEKIFKALSIKRRADIDDQNLFKKWTNDLCFEPENIIYVAKTLKKGGMEKLDQTLLQLYSMKCFSKEEMAEYFDKKQAVYNLAIKINRALSVYEEVIDTVIDTYTNKWLSYGFDDQALLFIASHCFKEGKNTLREMDSFIEYLRQRGFIDLSSVNDYLIELKKDDEFLSKLLMTCGINRRPTPWDRENLNTWKNWNFTEEMILEAGKIASGKGSPIAYVNGILSNWKNNNVYSPQDIVNSEKIKTSLKDDLSAENYNREYEKRRAKAVSIAQKNTELAMSIEGFPNLYERLFSLEKDLAFAELSNNLVLLSRLEHEKISTTEKIENLLKTKKLDLTDLSPKYKCSRCNDTGYVGTHRCDCFNK